MTTNHRPTLESKRGRDVAIKDTIQHARASRGQTSLKLRLDISGAQIDHRQGKRALQELEYDSKRLKRIDSRDQTPVGTPAGQDDTPSIIDSEPKLIPLEVKTRLLALQEFRNIDVVGPEQVAKIQKGEEYEISEASTDENSEWSGALESEDDDTEALMKELEKVKQERAEKERRSAIMLSNPLVAKDVSGKKEKKKSWRASSSFSRSKAESQSFTTDTLNSDVHKQFLSKYFH
ncbi:hypothetical protein HF325_001770 [Metschnikowia pulcherrima]|uniref:Pre-mRNA-splicing factor CWC15 n=1 Tax=Metschnikowia pulcherrima TaxID=27326 RepID=A0A8H7GWQ4_9ASCO|nr:hypothetical protein HF325_001770 [Metschnikowia pulcherrima]